MSLSAALGLIWQQFQNMFPMFVNFMFKFIVLLIFTLCGNGVVTKGGG